MSALSSDNSLSTKGSGSKVVTFPGNWPRSGVKIIFSHKRKYGSVRQKWELKEAQPTESPTQSPTFTPSSSTTAEPTAQPTDQPTDQPTTPITDQPTDQPTVHEPKKINIVSQLKGNNKKRFCLQVDPKRKITKDGHVFYDIITNVCSTIRFQKFYVDGFDQIRSKFKNKWGRDKDKCLKQRKDKKNGILFLVLQNCYGPDSKKLSALLSSDSSLSTKDGGKKVLTFPGNWPKLGVRIRFDDNKNRQNQKWKLKEAEEMEK